MGARECMDRGGDIPYRACHERMLCHWQNCIFCFKLAIIFCTKTIILEVDNSAGICLVFGRDPGLGMGIAVMLISL